MLNVSSIIAMILSFSDSEIGSGWITVYLAEQCVVGETFDAH